MLPKVVTNITKASTTLGDVAAIQYFTPSIGAEQEITYIVESPPIDEERPETPRARSRAKAGNFDAAPDTHEHGLLEDAKPGSEDLPATKEIGSIGATSRIPHTLGLRTEGIR